MIPTLPFDPPPSSPRPIDDPAPTAPHPSRPSHPDLPPLEQPESHPAAAPVFRNT